MVASPRLHVASLPYICVSLECQLLSHIQQMLSVHLMAKHRILRQVGMTGRSVRRGCPTSNRVQSQSACWDRVVC